MSEVWRDWVGGHWGELGTEAAEGLGGCVEDAGLEPRSGVPLPFPLHPLHSCSFYPTPPCTTTEDNEKCLQTLLRVPWGPGGHNNCSWLRTRFRPTGALRKRIYHKRGAGYCLSRCLEPAFPWALTLLSYRLPKPLLLGWESALFSLPCKVLLAPEALVTLIRTSLVSTGS